MPKKAKIEPIKINMMQVIEEVEPKIYKGKKFRRVKCLCDCWNIKIVRRYELKRWCIQSCWCILKRWMNTTHGLSKNPIYIKWNGMMARCYKESSSSYNRYWALWVRVCKEWHNVENFIKDMYPSYLEHLKVHGKPNTTLERKDNSKRYSKENCRRATIIEQARNRKSNIMYKWKCLTERCEELWLNYKRTHQRIKRDWKNIEDVLFVFSN